MRPRDYPRGYKASRVNESFRMAHHCQFDLFHGADEPAPVQNLSDRIHAYHRSLPNGARLTLIINDIRTVGCCGSEVRQLHFDFSRSGSNTVRLVPRTRKTFLSMRATSFFRHSRPLHRVAMCYRKKGIIFVGDLLRLPSSEILASFGKPEWIRVLEEELAGAGLAIGDRFSWWMRPAPY
jgi:hypothetical protein